jgi:importin subunit beta-1
MPLLLNGLHSVQEHQLCQVAIGIVVDLCDAVGGKIQPYCDKLMEGLQGIIQSDSAARELKPPVISCIGDIAMAISSAFEPYLQISVMLLMQASQQSAPIDDDEFTEFINTLRLSILEAYSGIVIGLADGNALHIFLANIQVILQFLQFLSTPESNKSEEVLKQAVSLIGDIAQRMGPINVNVLAQINQPFVVQLVTEAERSSDPTLVEVANWAKSVVQHV